MQRVWLDTLHHVHRRLLSFSTGKSSTELACQVVDADTEADLERVQQVVRTYEAAVLFELWFNSVSMTVYIGKE